jgi:sirohydrochlorin cobaltochelatase
MLVGHGSRSPEGVAEYWRLAAVLRDIAPTLEVGCGFIELAEPDLDTGFDDLVARGAGSVVAVPLVLLGASHLKADGPDAMARARVRHPGVHFAYARALGIHPALLALAETRVHQAVGSREGARTHVILVGRGSSDPDANADLYKVARLLWDGRGFAGVEASFVSLASPSVPEALERCRRLGATRVAVVPYFLFTGVLVERIQAQAEAWAAGAGSGVEVVVGGHLGAVEPVARLVLERQREALEGGALMNCDLCIYRVALPGYEDRVVRYAAPAAGQHHHHQGRS